jgi:hypothetical protein
MKAEAKSSSSLGADNDDENPGVTELASLRFQVSVLQEKVRYTNHFLAAHRKFNEAFARAMASLCQENKLPDYKTSSRWLASRESVGLPSTGVPAFDEVEGMRDAGAYDLESADEAAVLEKEKEKPAMRLL